MAKNSRVPFYFAVLACLAAVALLPPIPLLVVGVMAGIRWMVIGVGFYLAIGTVFLSMIAFPSPALARVVEQLEQGVFGVPQQPVSIFSVTGYARAVGAALFVELAITLVCVIVPFHSSPVALPVFLVAAMVLALHTAVWPGQKAIARPIAVALATIVVFSVIVGAFALTYFPQTTAVITSRASGADTGLAGFLSSVTLAGVFLWLILPALAILALVFANRLSLPWLVRWIAGLILFIAFLNLTGLVLKQHMGVRTASKAGVPVRLRSAEETSALGEGTYRVTLKPGEWSEVIKLPAGCRGCKFTSGPGDTVIAFEAYTASPKTEHQVFADKNFGDPVRDWMGGWRLKSATGGVIEIQITLRKWGDPPTPSK
jgi:hypothetical protein